VISDGAGQVPRQPVPVGDLAEARRQAADAQRRLRLLTDATGLISSMLDPRAAVQHLTRVAVPEFADWCLVAVVDATESLLEVRHRDPAVDAVVDELREHIIGNRRPSEPVRQVLSDGRPTLVAEVTEQMLATRVPDPVLRQAYRDLGMTSVIVAPLWARGRVIGNVSFVLADHSRPAYSEADLAVASELAQRTALALDNARLIARERQAVETLQRSLLPELPSVPGVAVAARYLPANDQAQVGGDWYDVLALPDGSIGLAIGDVMGHDLEAAAAMGQLRSVLRGYAWDGAEPASVLSRLDHLVTGLGMAQLATAIYGRLQLHAPTGATLDYANAGHLPPLLRRADGTAQLLDGAHAPMIGLPVVAERFQDRVDLPQGATLVLYTDGLVEDRSRSADEGVRELRRVVERVPPEASLEQLCEAILRDMRPESAGSDDLALLLLRLEDGGLEEG
jgi:serine phosphatase RsbU (regulator of sigma subunit)